MIPRVRCSLLTLLAALCLLVVAGATPDALGASSKAKSSQHRAPDPCQPPASPVFGNTTANRLLIALPPEPGSASPAVAAARAQDVLMAQLKSLSRAQWEDGWDLNSPPLRAAASSCAPRSEAEARILARRWGADAILWVPPTMTEGVSLTLLRSEGALQAGEFEPRQEPQLELEGLDLQGIPPSAPILPALLMSWHLYRTYQFSTAYTFVSRVLSQLPDDAPASPSLLRLQGLALYGVSRRWVPEALLLPGEPSQDSVAAPQQSPKTHTEAQTAGAGAPSEPDEDKGERNRRRVRQAATTLLQRALERCPEAEIVCRVKGLNALAWIDAEVGQHTASQEHLDQALELVKDTHDPVWLAAQEWRTALMQRSQLRCSSTPEQVSALMARIERVKQAISGLDEPGWQAGVMLEALKLTDRMEECKVEAAGEESKPPSAGELAARLARFDREKAVLEQALPLVNRTGHTHWVQDLRQNLQNLPLQRFLVARDWIEQAESDPTTAVEVMIQNAESPRAACRALTERAGMDWLLETPEAVLRLANAAVLCWERVTPTQPDRALRALLPLYRSRAYFEQEAPEKALAGHLEALASVKIPANRALELRMRMEIAQQLQDYGTPEQEIRAIQQALDLALSPDPRGGGNATKPRSLERSSGAGFRKRLPAPGSKAAQALARNDDLWPLAQRLGELHLEAGALADAADAFEVYGAWVGAGNQARVESLLTASRLYQDVGRPRDALRCLLGARSRLKPVAAYVVLPKFEFHDCEGPEHDRVNVDPHVALNALDALGSQLAELGRWVEARGVLEAIASLFQNAQWLRAAPEWEARVQYLLGVAYLRTGTPEKARPTFQRVATLLQAKPLAVASSAPAAVSAPEAPSPETPSSEPAAAFCVSARFTCIQWHEQRALQLLEQAKASEALATFTHVARLLEGTGDLRWQARIFEQLGRLKLGAKDGAGAATAFQQATARVEPLLFPDWKASLLIQEADARMLTGSWTVARARYQAALPLVVQQKNPVWEAQLQEKLKAVKEKEGD